MSKVTAKAKLASRLEDSYGNVQLTFYADYADGRNKEWAAATPNLNLQMTVKPSVSEMFEVGKGYTLTFEENTE